MLILLKRLGIDIFSETSHSALWYNENLFPISLSIIKKVIDKVDSLKLGSSTKHLFPSIMQKLKGISHSRARAGLSRARNIIYYNKVCKREGKILEGLKMVERRTRERGSYDERV